MREPHDPSSYWGSVGATVGAILALLVAFGVPLTDAQTTAILGVFAAVGPLVTAYLIRRTAWMPASVDKVVARAYHEGAFGDEARPPEELLADPGNAAADERIADEWDGDRPPSPPFT